MKRSVLIVTIIGLAIAAGAAYYLMRERCDSVTYYAFGNAVKIEECGK